MLNKTEWYRQKPIFDESDIQILVYNLSSAQWDC